MTGPCFEARTSDHTRQPSEPRAPAHWMDLDFSFSGFLQAESSCSVVQVGVGRPVPLDRCSSPYTERKPPGWPYRPCPGRQTGQMGRGVISGVCFICPALVIPAWEQPLGRKTNLLPTLPHDRATAQHWALSLPCVILCNRCYHYLPFPCHEDTEAHRDRLT